MKTVLVDKEGLQNKKPLGRFKTIQEFANFKTEIANKMLAKVDRKQL